MGRSSEIGKRIFVSFLITVFVISALAAFVWWVALPFITGLPVFGGLGANRNVVTFHTQNNLDPNIPEMIFGSNHITGHSNPIVEDTPNGHRIFLPASFVREFIDPFVFWDEGAQTFFISSHHALLEFTPGSQSFVVNGMTLPLETPIRRINEEIFLPVDLLHDLYPWIVDYNAQQNLVVITDSTVLHLPALVIRDNVPVRFWGTSQAPIAANLSSGTYVFVYAGEESMNPHEFVRVRTRDGIPGYISLSDILRGDYGYPDLGREPLLHLHGWIENRIAAPQNWQWGVRVNMVWDEIVIPQSNINSMERGLHPSVNVISPTWFVIDETGARVNSLVNRAYVEWARSNNVQVWPKVFDFSNERARRMLMNSDNRRHVINQLLHYADTLGIDGFNINFENLLNTSDGQYKVQFLRELAIPLRERGIVLSAALKPPYPFNMIYQPNLIGLTVDFVQVMTYNQNVVGLNSPGPNASLPWVQWAVETMLEEVPNYRLIMGLPYWVNIWKENVITGEVRIRQVGMMLAREIYRNYGGTEWEWREDYGLYYGGVATTYEGETWLVSIWFECERSIRAKMQIFATYQLAGVAGWVLGLEAPAVWDVLERFFQPV